MNYELEFDKRAWKEWNKLDSTLRKQFAGKLAERLLNPRVPADSLHGMPDHYKIKLRKAGYRLVYRVEDEVLIVLVLAIGKREGGEVYDIARTRQQ